jgi:hypothetical protein
MSTRWSVEQIEQWLRDNLTPPPLQRAPMSICGTRLATRAVH